MTTDPVSIPPENITVGMNITVDVRLTADVAAVDTSSGMFQLVELHLTEYFGPPGNGLAPGDIVDQQLPLDTAGLSDYPGMVLYQNVDRLTHRTWWERVSTGSVWFARADGLLQCEEAAGGDTVGAILDRVAIGSLTQVYP